MHLLCLNQFYLPDLAPTGRYLADLAGAMVLRGHKVTVVCSCWGYGGRGPFAARETLDGVEVYRVGGACFSRVSAFGKLVGYGSFYSGASRMLRRLSPGANVILSLTTPPYLGLLARRAANRAQTKHAHWIMDLYPDVMVAHGMLKEGSWPARCLEGLNRRQLRGSALTMTLGPDMEARIRRYVEPADGNGVGWAPLWAPFEPADATSGQAVGHGGGPLVLMYSGNMGRGHRFGEFLAAAESLRDDAGVRWVFAGDGPRRSELDLMLASCGFLYVESKPYVPHHRLREHLLEGDVHLISLDPSWDGCMVPSKLMAVFAVGRPVIFVGGAGNSVAKWIRESGGGWVVPPNDVDTLLAVIREARSAEERGRRGRAALNYARKHFSPREACGIMCGRLEAIG